MKGDEKKEKTRKTENKKTRPKFLGKALRAVPYRILIFMLFFFHGKKFEGALYIGQDGVDLSFFLCFACWHLGTLLSNPSFY